jgi:hypothetical protein
VALAVAFFPVRVDAGSGILNGSFEGPSIGPDNLVTGGGDFWTPNNSNVFIVSNNFGNLGTTPFGDQYLAFSSPSASDQQTVSGFLTGENYVLTLYFGDIANNAGPQLTVSLMGVATGSYIFNAPVSGPNGANPYSFQRIDIPFTTTADGDVTFALIDSGLASLAVDNVSIQAVPEASPVLLMFFSSAVVAVRFLFRLRRRSS